MNCFRLRPTDKLDMKYLRTCSVYRLLKHKRIGKARALELLLQRHGKSQERTMRALISIWINGPFKRLELAP